ncbi:hypothetical protein M758_5G130900 [Ceratodon purpureus]|nr:hypothetical protein M758_5G130900 [Ceratodon purpureus]
MFLPCLALTFTLVCLLTCPGNIVFIDSSVPAIPTSSISPLEIHKLASRFYSNSTSAPSSCQVVFSDQVLEFGLS